MRCSSPAYRRYEQLILGLALIMQVGQGEGAAAEAIRDAMDEPWGQLTGEEQDELRALSAELYQVRETAWR